ncbi:MAG: phytoene/squalene synthase family protein [Kofleriaceae bacterium]
MTTALVAIEPATVARATIAHHSKSFALASRLLGVRVRDQTAVIYTWCRRADDAVDEGYEDGVLARLDRELVAAYAGAAADPVLAAFGAVARERAIPIAYPRALLAGMAMDVDGTTYRTVEDVIGYAWRVAGVVGTMMTHVFGCADDGALVHAAHLGIAMQLTNICRDVAEDWRRGRLYLPAELLAAHGAPDLAAELGRPLPASAHPAIAATTSDLLALAARYYRSGDRGSSKLPLRAAVAVRAARRIYAAIGDRIARADYAVTAGRAIVPTSHKLALAATAIARSVFHLPRRHHVPRLTLELADVSRC